MNNRILTIDIGNTSVAIGLYADGDIVRRSYLPHAFTKKNLIISKIMETVGDTVVTGAAIASVVPDANANWIHIIEDHLGLTPLEIGHRLNLGVALTYPEPQSIGADRLANASGAVKRYGSPVIVADFGTALTFDVIAESDGYVGGIIAPGLPLMLDYLADKTALLPHISPEPTESIIGKSTEDAIRSGARWGYLGMVREILARIESELDLCDIQVCATGGFASWILDGIERDIIYDKTLTLFGIGHIYELNTMDRA